MLQITRAETDAHFAAGRALFEEYATSLGLDLSFQNFDEELTNLAKQYGAPEGCLLLAFDETQIAGCVALRRLDTYGCEMKRLYVKPQFRHLNIGKSLVEAILEEAKKLGYSRMRLDTLPSMRRAQRLYKSLGFRAIAPYRFNPVAGAIFMELHLPSDTKNNLSSLPAGADWTGIKTTRLRAILSFQRGNNGTIRSHHQNHAQTLAETRCV